MGKYAKTYKIYVLIISLLLIGSVCLVGCSASASKESYEDSLDYDEAPEPQKDYGEISGLDDFNASAKEEYYPADPEVSVPSGQKADRKFIENGNLELRSADVDETFIALSNLAKNLDGRVVSYDQDKGDTFKIIRMQVAVPYGKLADFMEHAGESATKIESQSVTSEEVTEDYYDTKTRLESTENLIKHYRDLLADAKTIEEILQVQARIDDLTLQLEALKGRLKVLDYLTQESFISITIRMEEDPTITKPEVTLKTLKWSDVSYLMKTGLHKTGIVIALGFQYLLIFFAYASPVIVLAIILIIVIKHRRKKLRKKNSAGKTTDKKELKQRLKAENRGESKNEEITKEAENKEE
ncbi:MAG: DUF4349 domain-containing protein [Saccharofermentanales bacterium]|jgi:hypothetical protein|nr:DUF4349 domain-containing protein [Bacillota bacterium]